MTSPGVPIQRRIWGGQQNAHHGEHKPGRDAQRYGGVEGAERFSRSSAP